MGEPAADDQPRITGETTFIEQVAEPPPPPFERAVAYPTSTAVVLALGTFHTTILVVPVLIQLYLSGSLGDGLDRLNTLLGLVLFAALWAIVCTMTGRALERLGWPSGLRRSDIVPEGARAGGIAGAVVLVVGVPLVALLAVLSSPDAGVDGFAGALLVLPILGLIGSPFAFAVGALVGLLVGLVDYLLVRAVDAVVTRSLRAPN